MQDRVMPQPKDAKFGPTWTDVHHLLDWLRAAYPGTYEIRLMPPYRARGHVTWSNWAVWVVRTKGLTEPTETLGGQEPWGPGTMYATASQAAWAALVMLLRNLEKREAQAQQRSLF